MLFAAAILATQLSVGGSLAQAMQTAPEADGRPVAPVKPAFAAVDARACDSAAERDRIFGSIDMEEPPNFVYLRALAAHNEALMTWKLDRLAARAKWSKARQAEFALKMLDDPAFAAAFEASMKQLEPMMAGVEAILEAKSDEAKQCRLVLGMVDQLDDISDGAALQWKAMEAVIDKEAARLGVSLE